MVADFFLRTYPKDYRWLPFLFRSLERHARGWRDVVLVFPFEGPGDDFAAELAALEVFVPLKETAERLRAAGALSGKIIVQTCPVYQDDYLGQCLTKLMAWQYSSADEVCFLDSDLVLVQPLTPRTLHAPGDGRPVIEIRDWADSGNALTAWFGITKTLLHGDSPPYETMCRHPFQYPTPFLRRAFEAAYQELMTVDRHISEFNYLGNYAFLRERDAFLFLRPDHLHQEGLDAPDFHASDLVRQFRSWDGLTPAVKAELKALGYWTAEDDAHAGR